MTVQTKEQLTQAHCAPCEGGVDKLSADEARQQLAQLDGWKLNSDSTQIEKKWNRGDFVSSLAFVNRIGEIGEQQNHHPDLHVEGYRNVRVVLSTHAIGGLSVNDFIVAARIDELQD